MNHMADEVAIGADGLTRYYGELLAVDHISFSVGEGEFFGFLGPNGAGKTTTINMLTTLLEPSEGAGYIHGYDISRQAYQAKRHFGVVPEESNIYDELSCWDNLTFTARLYRVPRREAVERASELLERFGLGDRRKEKARTLSRGLKRRLTIGMALIHQPRVLFLDEPTAGLDVQSAIAIREFVRHLNEEGVTIFLTTHNIEEANRLCERVAIINRGQIAAIDRPENLRGAFQSAQSVEVAFREGSEPYREALSSVPGVISLTKEGNRYRLYTADPGGLLAHLFAYTQGEGLELESVNTVEPSLEDVFLRLTGGEMGSLPDGSREEGSVSEPRRRRRR